MEPKRRQGIESRPGVVERRVRAVLCVLACGVCALPVPARTEEPPKASAQTSAKQSASAAPVRYRPERFAGRAGRYYPLVWGVDSLSVKLVESGEVVRFTYRVLDPDKARALNDKKNEPSLVAPRAGVRLVVPNMEKIGQLRQSAAPEAGKAYWMAFSNKGRPVKKGDRVDVVIGFFRAQGLVVD
jgi:hypothetical protein